MSRNTPPSELYQALLDLKPFFKRAAGFSVVASLLILAPTVYMLEVYDRVVNSRNHMTLVMLTIMVLAAVALMEVSAGSVIFFRPATNFMAPMKQAL